MVHSFNRVDATRRLLAAAFSALIATPAAAIVGGTPTTDFGVVSSGVQVLPNWVLTARHVGLSVGATYSNGFGSAVIAQRYDAGSGVTLSDDLALLRLATPIAAPSLGLVGSSLAPGQGYALDATLTTGANQQPRGYAFAQVRQFAPRFDLDGSGPLAEQPVNWLILHNDSFTAPYVQGGDSGGGLFLGHVTGLAGGAPLWGIGSAALTGESPGGTLHGSAYVQLASYRGWLDATLASDAADTQVLNWMSSPVPEPATGLLMLLGLCGMARRRR